MTGPEANQIMGAIKELKAEFYKLRQLIVGNGDRDAVLPRLNDAENRLASLEVTASETKKVQPVINAAFWAAKVSQHIIKAITVAGILYLIFGP